MPEVWIPTGARKLTGGQQRVRVTGSTIRQVVDSLDKVYPGVKARLCDDDGIMPGIAVIVDSEATNIGLLQQVQEDSEVHFLPAIGVEQPDVTPSYGQVPRPSRAGHEGFRHWRPGGASGPAVLVNSPKPG